MGMFDEVKIHKDLIPPHNGNIKPSTVFQTKDFESLLDTYVITKDKLLILNGIKIMDFNDHFFFYHLDENNEWIEFAAEFKDGLLVEIDCITHVKPQISP